MQVEHDLTALGSTVRDDAIARFAYAVFFRQLASHLQHMSEEFCIVVLYVRDRGDVTNGNDEQMDGSGRINVSKGDDPIVLIHEVRR